MQYFPNSQTVIYFWVISASELLLGVIIDENSPISGMTPVQILSLVESQEEEMLEYRIIIKTDFIDEAMK